jgi:hypothetical protein
VLRSEDGQIERVIEWGGGLIGDVGSSGDGGGGGGGHLEASLQGVATIGHEIFAIAFHASFIRVLDLFTGEVLRDMEAGLTTGRKRIHHFHGCLFVTDLRGNQVRAFDSAGTPLAAWTSSASFRGPCGCAFRVLPGPGRSAECFVVDEGNHRVQVFSIGRLASWSPDRHESCPPAVRDRAVELVRLGHLLSLTLRDEQQVPLRDVWRAFVMPCAMDVCLVPGV